MEKEITVIAKNGIKIHSYRNSATHGFYISLFLRAGSMYESENECGITHFLEHALIRNVNTIMNGELYPTLDRLGIEFNASTYSEMVQFYISGASEKFSFGSEIASLLLAPIALSKSEFYAERERIKAEIRESDDRTSLSSFANGIVYEGTSLARPILGTLGGVSKISLAKLEEYRKSVFSPENVFFYVTGNFTDADIQNMASLIGKAPLSSLPGRTNYAPVPLGFGKRKADVYIKNADFTMVRFNFDLDMSKLTMGVVDLIYDILLGGYNSKLFIEMSEKRGLFYDLNGAVEKYSNIGGFTFSFEVRSGSVYDAIENTLLILKELKGTELTEDGCMKAGYVDNGKLLYDDNRELNFTFAYDCHVMGATYSDIEQRAASYSAITPEAIRSAAFKIFKTENLTLAIKGNKKKIDAVRIKELLSIISDN